MALFETKDRNSRQRTYMRLEVGDCVVQSVKLLLAAASVALKRTKNRSFFGFLSGITPNYLRLSEIAFLHLVQIFY